MVNLNMHCAITFSTNGASGALVFCVQRKIRRPIHAVPLSQTFDETKGVVRFWIWIQYPEFLQLLESLFFIRLPICATLALIQQPLSVVTTL